MDSPKARLGILEFTESVLGIRPYPWQRTTLCHIEAGHPTALTACNGAGKTSTVLVAAALWCLFNWPLARVIVTSASWSQLKKQFFDTIRTWQRHPLFRFHLNALGRMGKSNLKQKIRHRAQPLIEAAGKRFPELVTVTDEAVNCRNHYVHGSGSKGPRFDYSDNLDTVFFFTDTLEFVFAASDLIEAGWDVKAWSELMTTMSHPFAQYRINYDFHLKKLKALLGQTATTSS
jgi:hypothetical protein